MKIEPDNRGYTILEAMIFIAVSGLILVGALVAMGGRQEQVQYQQSIRDLDAHIRGVINDVSNGFYPSQQLTCSEEADRLSIAPSVSATDQQGTNEQCVFAGKLIDFTNQDQITIVSLAGARPALGATASIGDAKLTPINGAAVNLNQSIQNSWGLIARAVDESGESVSYLGYISDFGREAGSGRIDSGTQSIRLYKNGVTESTVPSYPTIISPVAVGSSAAIYICLESANANQKAVIIVGKDGRQLTTTIDQDATGKYETQCGADF